MVIFSMKCPKCGLTQSLSPTCKSCGASVPNPATHTIQLPSQSRGRKIPPPPSAPSPRQQSSSSQTEQDMSSVHRLTFYGMGDALFGIQTVNLFLTIITLGIYSFWGRVRVRHYFMSQTRFADDRFAYHGSGKELLVGFLKAALVFGVPIVFLIVVRDVLDVDNITKAVAAFLSSVIAFALYPFATVGARHYRLSRTSWRGIRFSFRGRVWSLFYILLESSLLIPLTLGLYYPFFATKKQGFMVTHSYFGNERFSFDGEGSDLFGSFVLALLLTIPTFGLCWFWFVAKKQRYFWDHTTFASSRFHSTVPGGSLLFLKATNLSFLLVTLGLGWSWIKVRTVRFYLNHLSFQGPLDLEGIVQEAQLSTATGEGLAGFFDLDAGFDLG